MLAIIDLMTLNKVENLNAIINKPKACKAIQFNSSKSKKIKSNKAMNKDMTTETLLLVKSSNKSFRLSSVDVSDTNFDLMFTLLSYLEYDFDMISFSPEIDLKSCLLFVSEYFESKQTMMLGKCDDSVKVHSDIKDEFNIVITK